MDKALLESVLVKFSDFGLKILAALAVWIIGRMVIRFLLKVLVSRLDHRKVDPTISAYGRNIISVLLNIVLVIVLMGVVGIETTSFAAFIAGAGLAVGAAWSGLLANFAAGAFLVVLRPFKRGDYISGGGVTGTVHEIGMFVTTIVTDDQVAAFVGNGKILAENLRNYSANPSRRIDLTGSIPRSADAAEMMVAVRERLQKIPNVLSTPPCEVQVLSFNNEYFKLAIRPYAHTDHYWQVYFDATQALQGLLASVGMGASSGFERGEEAGGEGAEAGEEGGEEEGNEGGQKEPRERAESAE